MTGRPEFCPIFLDLFWLLGLSSSIWLVRYAESMFSSPYRIYRALLIDNEELCIRLTVQATAAAVWTDRHKSIPAASG